MKKTIDYVVNKHAPWSAKEVMYLYARNTPGVYAELDKNNIYLIINNIKYKCVRWGFRPDVFNEECEVVTIYLEEVEKMKRQVKLKIGQVYQNKGGGNFLCIKEIDENVYMMLNIKSRWMLEAHEITMYEDGTIEWDYSSHGYFSELKYKGETK